LEQKSEELDCMIIALEIMPDHVHLFLNCPPVMAPDQIMFRLKGYSSRVLRNRYPILMVFLLFGPDHIFARRPGTFQTQQSNATSPSRRATDDSSHPLKEWAFSAFSVNRKRLTNERQRFNRKARIYRHEDHHARAAEAPEAPEAPQAEKG
jgi:hypothetical protein